MDQFNIDDRMSFSDEDFGAWHQAHMDEKRRRYEESRRELMPEALERYFRAYPKVTNYILEQVKGYGVKDIFHLVHDDFEFCELLMDEMRDDLEDAGILEAIEHDLRCLFKCNNHASTSNLLLAMKQHIYWCVYNKVDCIIDECEDYINIGWEDILDQQMGWGSRSV